MSKRAAKAIDPVVCLRRSSLCLELITVEPLLDLAVSWSMLFRRSDSTVVLSCFWLAVHGKPVLFWKGISGLKFPCFLFMHAKATGPFEFRAVPIL